jgi:hypothetical protein
MTIKSNEDLDFKDKFLLKNPSLQKTHKEEPMFSMV